MKQFFLSAWEVLEVVLIAAVTVFLVRTFLIQPFLVSGASMEPNFSDGNYLLIDEITYRFREPQRGEVVVFRYPNNPSVYYIKRIIGLPGEKLVVKNSQIAAYNDQTPGGLIVKEDYLKSDVRTSGDSDIQLKDNEYYVMGDNRYYSFDSRNWGPVDREDIIGLVRLRLFPITQLKAFAAPNY